MHGKAKRIARSALQCRLLASSSETNPRYYLANVQRMQVVSVWIITATLFSCRSNVPWQIGKWGPYLSSALKELSYGV